jgi:hypothetical protein
VRWDRKLVFTVLEGSTLVGQLGKLKDCDMQLEVCTVRYARSWGGMRERDDAFVSGSLEDPLFSRES